jgi:hypothetical protein
MAPSNKDPKPQLTEREKKLAQALRANLRRRKIGGGAPGGLGGGRPGAAKSEDMA